MNIDFDIYHEMRAECAAVLARHGISERHCVMDRLLSREQIRNAVIRNEYEEAKPAFGDAAETRDALARKWRMGKSYLKKILYAE